MKKTIAERIAAAEERKAQLSARLTSMKGRQKAVDRKRDTKRKIVVGAAVLVEMERDPKFSAYIRKMLEKAVGRTQDREAIADLLPAAAEVTAPAPASNANTPLAPAAPAGNLPGSPFPPGPVNPPNGSSYPLRVREKVTGYF